jgi:signal transduction histidine kinase
MSRSAGLWRRYSFAVLFVLTAFGIRYLMTPVLGEELPFMLFIAAALVAAWYGGAVSGIIALLVGLFLGDYFFLWPTQTAPMSRSMVIVHLVRYVFTASLGIVLIETLHRSRRRLEQAKDILRMHAGELEKRVAERTESLAATVKSLEGILYHIAHNLRAPLRAMSGYSGILISEYEAKLDPTGKDYLLHISEASRRMDHLIKALLDYGRLSHMEINITHVKCDQAVERSLFSLGYQIKATKADVKVMGVLPAVRADERVLEQVINNLIDNALKFSAVGSTPQIEIWAERKDDVVRISIRDNGIGVPEQFHQRIFRPFECLHPRETYEGTGIGLAIVKEGVERMGGQVGLQSKLGHGSVFWVELPAAEKGGIDRKTNPRVREIDSLSGIKPHLESGTPRGLDRPRRGASLQYRYRVIVPTSVPAPDEPRTPEDIVKDSNAKNKTTDDTDNTDE